MDRKTGFTLIELLVTVTILGVLSVVLLSSFTKILLKGRDTRRKSDLILIQKTLEAYYDDHDSCYPETLVCGQALSPYTSSIPCDPTDSATDQYYYSVSTNGSCKKWYKLFAKLENVADSDIAKISCVPTVCGHYNYGVSSQNVRLLDIQLGESSVP